MYHRVGGFGPLEPGPPVEIFWVAGLGRAECFFLGGWSGPGRGFRQWPDVEKGFCRLFTLSSYLTNGRENEQWSSAKDLAVVVGRMTVGAQQWDCKLVNANANPLDHWKARQLQFLKLIALARRMYAIPVSAAQVADCGH